jgi:hypothetical protein
MHGEELRRILDQVTEEILGQMREGFYYKGEFRFDPIVWDINNGYCEDWAERAAELLRERGQRAFTAWIDPDVDHCVLVYNGKFYDADCPDGVDRWSQLPMFADPQGKRPEP